MPASGARQASANEMLEAPVHSMYRGQGWGPAPRGRTTVVSFFFSGSLSGQSPQNADPPAFNSARSREITGPAQTSWTAALRASPSTRLPYGSAQPQTMRPSQSMTRVVQGHVH